MRHRLKFWIAKFRIRRELAKGTVIEKHMQWFPDMKEIPARPISGKEAVGYFDSCDISLNRYSNGDPVVCLVYDGGCMGQLAMQIARLFRKRTGFGVNSAFRLKPIPLTNDRYNELISQSS